MSPKRPSGISTTPCEQCPLRGLPHFRDFSPPELNFVSHFKTGELSVESGAIVLMEGSHSAHLYTVLEGWGFRYKTLEDGRRQILNYIMPGDLIGLQGTIMGEMQHSVEALSPVTLCVFERGRLNTLFIDHPSLAYDLTWIAASEERMLDSHLLSVGRRTALERAAYLLAFLHDKASRVGLLDGNAVIPVTQQHVADTLGLSIVHTNKTLRKLAERNFIRWIDKGCMVLDEDGLADVAGWDREPRKGRPFI
ncbi:Crp/Fnr family transcriptional regulator [Agrobacterium larrymoorei]|uniref:Crp/Fnr family transcriptional regulator n=1 Tax=Agrobacterium larrymoorei TaxID=160699 RepID=UPI00157438DF|nr:Crp/Fnr family transcriptional regulator [Agrobacterium larrymoorei]NTJ41974.1 Crp/Fnr family transcriptional regulator [Agrobacterium larrymoorei]